MAGRPAGRAARPRAGWERDGGRARAARDGQARPVRPVRQLLSARNVLHRRGRLVPGRRQGRDDRPGTDRRGRQPRRGLRGADLGGRQRHGAGQADHERPAPARQLPPGRGYPGTNPVEIPVAIGASAQTPAEGAPTPTPTGGTNGTAPTQLPRAPAQLPTLSSRGLPGGDGDRSFVSVGPAPPRPISPRFGLANILPDGGTVPGAPASATVAWMARAREAGAGGNRWEFRWERSSRRPGAYDWREVDRVVAANQAAGLPLLAILIGTPAWAGPAAGAPPRRARGRADPGRRDDQLGQPVGALRPRLREPLPRPDRGLRDLERAEPARLLERVARPTTTACSSTAMAAIRHADPAATVVFGGLDGYRDVRFLDGVLEAAAADPAPPGRRGAFDALGWHAYHRPFDVYTGTWALRDRLRARGFQQPIWVTETNVAAWDDRPVRGDAAAPYRFSATADEQAAFVLEIARLRSRGRRRADLLLPRFRRRRGRGVGPAAGRRRRAPGRARLPLRDRASGRRPVGASRRRRRRRAHRRRPAGRARHGRVGDRPGRRAARLRRRRSPARPSYATRSAASARSCRSTGGSSCRCPARAPATARTPATTSSAATPT